MNRQRFGAQFVGKVANPTEILQFMKATAKKKDVKKKDGEEDPDFDDEAYSGMLLRHTA